MASIRELNAINIVKGTKHDFTDTQSSESISIEVKQCATASFRLVAKKVFNMLFIISCIAEVVNIISGFTHYRNISLSLLISFIFSLCLVIVIMEAHIENAYTPDKLKDAYNSAIKLKWLLEDIDMSGPIYIEVRPYKIFKGSTDGELKLEFKDKRTDEIVIQSFFYKETLYEKEVKVTTFRVDTSRKTGTQLVLPKRLEVLSI